MFSKLLPRLLHQENQNSLKHEIPRNKLKKDLNDLYNENYKALSKKIKKLSENGKHSMFMDRQKQYSKISI
jgi:hypothetical protein